MRLLLINKYLYRRIELCNIMIMTLFLMVILLMRPFESVMHTEQNLVKMFEFYKNKYGRHYANKKTEGIALNNFINNLKKVDSLNEKATDKFHLYELNRYADVDPEDFELHFGIDVSPYDNVLNETSNKIMRNKKPVSVEQTRLHDLTKADKLYKDYLNKYKKNYPKKKDNMIHYYRFIKTLVELNRGKMGGNMEHLDEYADVLDEPNEFFY